MNPYLILLIFTLLVLTVVGLIVGLNALLGPRLRGSDVKMEPFECGSIPQQTVNTRPLSIKYYPVAVLFLIFDVEAVLLFVWALSSGEASMIDLSFGSFLFFMTLLTLAFGYLWKEGAFRWE